MTMAGVYDHGVFGLSGGERALPLRHVTAARDGNHLLDPNIRRNLRMCARFRLSACHALNGGRRRALRGANGARWPGDLRENG